MEVCARRGGWGPFNPSRDFDLAPCFEDAILTSLNVLLLFATLFRTWSLFRRTTLSKTSKSTLILWSKTVSLDLDVDVVGSRFIGLTGSFIVCFYRIYFQICHCNPPPPAIRPTGRRDSVVHVYSPGCYRCVDMSRAHTDSHLINYLATLLSRFSNPSSRSFTYLGRHDIC